MGAKIILTLTLLGLLAFANAQDETTCPPRGCERTYQPVCGSDGQTHPNRCVAVCEKKVTVVSDGVCPGGETQAPLFNRK